MTTFAECLAALPAFRNALLRQQSLARPLLGDETLWAQRVSSPLLGPVPSSAEPAERAAAFAVEGAYAAYATPLTNIHATGVGIRRRGQEYDPTAYVIKVFVFAQVEMAVAALPQTTEDGIPVDIEVMPIQVVRARKAGKKGAHDRDATGDTGPSQAPAGAAVPQRGTVAAAAGTAAPAGAMPQRDRHRPILAGLSISPLHANYVGTLGCFLLKRHVDTEEVFVLSNNHVLANVDQLPVGTPIVQPGPEGPPFLAAVQDAFATLHTVIPITFPTGAGGAPPAFNRFDAALAQVTHGAMIQPGQMFGLPMAPGAPYDPSRVLPPVPGMRVMKMGRTTGFTRGSIIATHLQGVQVNYGTPQFPRIAVFQDVMRIMGDGTSPFSLPGDSGAVILEEATGHPVALLFAGDGVRTTACDLGALCQQLGAWPI